MSYAGDSAHGAILCPNYSILQTSWRVDGCYFHMVCLHTMMYVATCHHPVHPGVLEISDHLQNWCGFWKHWTMAVSV